MGDIDSASKIREEERRLNQKIFGSSSFFPGDVFLSRGSRNYPNPPLCSKPCVDRACEGKKHGDDFDCRDCSQHFCTRHYLIHLLQAADRKDHPNLVELIRHVHSFLELKGDILELFGGKEAKELVVLF